MEIHLSYSPFKTPVYNSPEVEKGEGVLNFYHILFFENNML